jgi:segregation and condensation protein B
VTVLESVAREDIKQALGEMKVAYAAGGRGIVLEEVANGYQLRTPKEHALYVRKLLAAKPPRLSRPLLEAVAIVAYRQPITRPEIEQLRGVDCGGVIDTLIERRLIQIAGRKEAPGRPIMYTTTREFLELFGLKDLSGLPDLEELRLIERPREEALFANIDDTGSTETAGGAQSVEYPSGAEPTGTDSAEATMTGEFQAAQPADAAERTAESESILAIASPAAPSNDESAEHESVSSPADTEDHDWD